MALATVAKTEIINNFKTSKKDTGSSAIQIALLTSQISEITNHLQTHKKDITARRSLLKKVAKRARLLKYLQNHDFKSYQQVVQQLKLRVKQNA